MIKTLFKVFKRDQESIKLIKMSKGKRILLNIVIIVAVIAAFAAMLSPFIIHSDEIKDAIPLNIGNIALMLGFYLTFILALISAFGFLFSGGYLDKNLKNYIVLPINHRQFIIAKLAMVYYNVISLVGLVMVPFVIMYFIYAQVSINGILSIILYVITMPLIVIYAVSFVLGTILYFVNKVKNKALAKNILYSLFFVVSFGVYFGFIFSLNSSSSEDPMVAVAMILDLMDKIGIFFFYSGWATDLLNNAAYINVLYMIIAVASGILFLLYFEKVYFKGSIGFNEGGSLRKSKKRKNTGVPRYSMTTWFFIREAKEIFKTGTYFFNSVFGNILIVVIYLGMMGYAYFFQFNAEDTQEILSLINDNLNIEFVILITIAIGTFFTIFNNGAATVFSRDAKSLNFINTLPLNQSRAFFGKVLFHGTIEFLTLFIFMLIPMLVLQINILYILTAVIVMILIILATIFIPVCVDLNFPNLDWESETAVVKRSKSIWITMILHVILNAIIFGGGISLGVFLDVDYKIISYLGIVFYAIMFVVLLIFYRRSVVNAFRKVKN